MPYNKIMPSKIVSYYKIELEENEVEKVLQLEENKGCELEKEGRIEEIQDLGKMIIKEGYAEDSSNFKV
jgi:hypothetical protein